jgi:hypothetical protein
MQPDTSVTVARKHSNYLLRGRMTQNNYHQDLLLELATHWTTDQLDAYILQQEDRLAHTRELIRDLKELKRKRSKKYTAENGVRDGR